MKFVMHKIVVVGLRCLAPFHGQIIHTKKTTTSESNAKVNSLTFQPFVESHNSFCEKGKLIIHMVRNSNDGTRVKKKKQADADTDTKWTLWPPKELIRMKQKTNVK